MDYRAEAKIACMELLCHKSKKVVEEFLRRIDTAETDAAISRVMADVRHAI